MKTLLFAILAVSSLSYAQSDSQRFNIPFAFHVGDRLMAAGEYSVGATGSGVLMVRSNGAGADVAMALANRTGSGGPVLATLIFNKFGNNYFLREAYSGNGSVGFELNKSHLEREVVKSSVIAEREEEKVRLLAKAQVRGR
jgi:hypothetical protein